MPGFFTHYLCGAKTLAVLECSTLRAVMEKYRTLFNLGAQGPDIFFFYRAWPWTGSRGIDKTGGMMHSRDIQSFFSNALEHIRKQDVRTQDLLKAYLCGFICHYALDCAAHPFIFYKSGFAQGEPSQAKKYTTFHTLYETALDVLMLERELSAVPYDMNAPALIRITDLQAQAVGEMMAAAINQSYGVERKAEEVMTAIKDMRNIYSLLREKHGLKKMLFSRMEALVGNPGLVSAIIYPTRIDDGIDYLNLSHTAWYLPWDAAVPHHESFPELFGLAVAEGKALCEAANAALLGMADPATVIKLMCNRNFSTGLDCCADVELKYHDCVYESKDKKAGRR
jgi:hypothetical protein